MISLIGMHGVILVAARERDLLDEQEGCGETLNPVSRRDTTGLEGLKHFVNLWEL